jgi:hypothetical protein
VWLGRDFLKLLAAGQHHRARLHSALLAPAHNTPVRPDTLVVKVPSWVVKVPGNSA